MQAEQKALVELEGGRELLQDLPHAVDELREDRRRLLVVYRLDVAAPVDELVAERQPLFFNQHLKKIR